MLLPLRSIPKTPEEFVAAGRAVQRFWLTSAKLNLGFQPEQTPVIFSRYIDNNLQFTEDRKVNANAAKGKALFESIMGQPDKVVFLGRLGRSKAPLSRSIRRPLKELLIND